MFQALIGTVETAHDDGDGGRADVFQALIGTVETHSAACHGMRITRFKPS